MEEPPVKMVKSAHRALELLELLSTESDGLSQAAIAHKLALSKSTAFELVRTMLARQYIAYDPSSKRYTSGSAALALAARFVDRASDVRTADSMGKRLFAETGCPVHVGVLSGDAVIVVRQYGELGGRDPVHSPAAQRLPLFGCALGKALAAFRNDEERKQLWRLAGGEQAEWEAVRRDLDETALVGFAIDAEEYMPGCYGWAVPVFGPNREVRAAVAVYYEKAGDDYDGFSRFAFRVAEEASALNGPSGWVQAATGDDTRFHKFVCVSLPNLFSPKSLVYVSTWEELAAADKSELWLVTNCHDNEWKQRWMMEWVVTVRKPDCFVVVPVNALQSDALFRLANRHGIPALCFQRPSRSRHVDYYVGGDGYEQGLLQLEYVARRLNGRVGVVILEGDPYNDNARNMAYGYRDVFQAHPRLKRISSIPIANWNPAEARRAVCELLDRGEKIDAIVAGTDQMASAVIGELERRGLNGKVLVVGGDGDRSAVRLIRNRMQHATVFQHPRDAAEAVHEVAGALAAGGINCDRMRQTTIARDDPGRPMWAVVVPCTLIDKSNVGDLEAYWSEYLRMNGSGDEHAQR